MSRQRRTEPAAARASAAFSEPGWMLADPTLALYAADGTA